MNEVELLDSIGPNITLGEWLVYYIQTYVKNIAKPSSVEHFGDNFFKHIIPFLGQKKLIEVTTADIQKLFNFKANSGNLKTGGPLSPKSVKNMRICLNVAMKQAVAEGLIPGNPVQETAIKRVRSKRVEAMTDNDQSILEEHLFNEACSLSRGEIFCIHTGMRRGEACSLRFGKFNMSDGSIHIEETVKRLTNIDAQDGDTKTKLVFSSVKSDSSDRILTLPIFLREIIEDQRAAFNDQFGRFPSDDDFIFFSSKGTVIDPDELTHHHNDALKKLGLEHKKLHAHRHTFAIRGLEQGCDIGTMAGLIGHSDSATTMRFYVKARRDSMDKTMLSVQRLASPT